MAKVKEKEARREGKRNEDSKKRKWSKGQWKRENRQLVFWNKSSSYTLLYNLNYFVKQTTQLYRLCSVIYPLWKSKECEEITGM
jgi:hypothetical protein